MRLSRELEISLTLAIKEAKKRRHEFLCLEHVLYALLFDEAVADFDAAEVARLRGQPDTAAAQVATAEAIDAAGGS